VKYLGGTFIETARLMLKERPELVFVIPAASVDRRNQIEALLAEQPEPLPIQVLLGQSQVCMAAADAILLASGTATLEAMLMKRPMVVSYKVSTVTMWIWRRMVIQPYVSLPNLLAGRKVVPEILQEEAIPCNLSKAVLASLENTDEAHQLQETFLFIHKQLKRNADVEAADAIARLIEQ